MILRCSWCGEDFVIRSVGLAYNETDGTYPREWKLRCPHNHEIAASSQDRAAMLYSVRRAVDILRRAEKDLAKRPQDMRPRSAPEARKEGA